MTLETPQIEEEFKTITSEKENPGEAPTFSGSEKAPVCLCGTFVRYYARKATLRGASFLTDVIFVEKPPHSKNAKYPKKYISGSSLALQEFPKQL